MQQFCYQELSPPLLPTTGMSSRYLPWGHLSWLMLQELSVQSFCQQSRPMEWGYPKTTHLTIKQCQSCLNEQGSKGMVQLFSENSSMKAASSGTTSALIFQSSSWSSRWTVPRWGSQWSFLSSLKVENSLAYCTWSLYKWVDWQVEPPLEAELVPDTLLELARQPSRKSLQYPSKSAPSA